MSNPEEINLRGKGLSYFFTWDNSHNSKVNPVLPFFLLVLNALYTVIGVRLRDLRPNGACELNINRTVGVVEHFDRVGLFWGLLSIYPIISLVMVLVQIVFHVFQHRKDNERAQRQQQGDHVDQGYPGSHEDQEKEKAQRVQNVEILHIALVNSLIIISGSLYLAADNFFFLVDPDDQSHSPSTTRSFIAGSSFICSLLVFAVDHFRFTDLVNKCLMTCNCVERANYKPNNNENELNVISILYFWSPLATFITTFDSLFISVVNEISGEESVRSGFDCSNERGAEGAIIFYIAICILYVISSGVYVVFKIITKTVYLRRYARARASNILINGFTYLSYIGYFSFIGIVFIIIGLMFIASDNNWPWICLAKNDDRICYWVMVRVDFLTTVTVVLFLYFWASVAISLFKCCLKLEGNLNPAEPTNKSVHRNENCHC